MEGYGGRRRGGWPGLRGAIRRYPEGGVYVLLGSALWAFPLLRILHVESAAVVAFAAFFVAGLGALRRFAQGLSFERVLRDQELGLLLPLILLTLSLLWEPNCGYLQGLLFYVLFPVVSVALAVGLAFALSAAPWRPRKTLFCGIGLAVAGLTPLYDLGLHPQFYVYNHVFGGVLGPLYDEELAVRPGLFTFRGLTLLWAGLCYLIGRHLRLRHRAGASGVPAVVGVVMLIGLYYLFAAPLGINTPAWYLQRALGGVYRTAHFDLYYDPASLSPAEVHLLAEDHEYRYRWLAQQLEVEVPARIESYLYPDPATRARLTGARYTNVAPVWLPTPQVHMLLASYHDAFGHELAHVFSREFGLPLLKASLAVGLVEGLAVALEPPDGRPGPHEQVAVAMWQRHLEGGDELPDLAAGLARRLTPLGFWTGRGAISYTTTGSFVRFLLNTYGAQPLKDVYAFGRFEAVYGKPVEVLAREWQQALLAQPVVARATEAFMARRFAVPSLFEKMCPHHVPSYRRLYRSGLAALAAGDTTAALVRLEASLDEQPAYAAALNAWAHVRLAQGAASAVVARLDTAQVAAEVPALAVRLGDAYALLGRPHTAQAHYDAALRRLPLFEHEEASLVILRKGLAEQPEVVQILVSGDALQVQAERLAGVENRSPVVEVYRAVSLAGAGRYEQAAALLRSTVPPEAGSVPPDQSGLLRRQRLVWLAQMYYRSGAPEAAGAYAAQAVRGFLAVGALNEAARWEDFVAKMLWALGRAERVATSRRIPCPAEAFICKPDDKRSTS